MTPRTARGVRAFVDPELSPSGRVVVLVLRRLHVPPKPTNAGPKMFAAKIGFALSAAYVVLYLAGATTAAAVCGLVLLFCAGLEAFVGFCLGCWMYQFVPHPGAGASRRLTPQPVAAPDRERQRR